MSQSFVDALSWVPKSRGLASTLARAYDYARAQAHRAVTLEHLLLALIADGDASRVLQACNVDLSRLNADASNYLLGLVDRVLPDHAGEPGIDPTLIRILDYASAAAQQSRRPEVNGAIVLAAIVGDGGSAAAAMLRAQGLTFEEAIRALQRATSAGRVAGSPSAVPGPTPAQAAPSNWSAPPPITPQPAPPMPGPPESTYPKSLSQVAAGDPLTGAWGSTTEEILANARHRVDAGRTSVAMPPAPNPAGQGQPGSHLQPHVEPWSEPQPTAQLSELREPWGNAGTDPHSQAGSNDQAQQIAGPAAEELAVAAAISPAARDGGALSAVPASDWAPEATSPGRPGAPLSASPIPVNQPDPRRDFAFDGNIAGPPYLAPDEALFSRVPTAAAWTAAPAPPPQRQTAAPPAGRLAENLPRTVQVGKPKSVEARIAKASVRVLAEGLQGGGTAYPHDVIITKAMSMRLRAPDGGFWIEAASPETQWIENTLGPLTDDFASWRWTVTAQRRGRLRLQLVISARTVGADGLATETALQDQIIDVRVRTNYGRLAARWGGWITAAMAGGVLARFGEGIWHAGRAALDRLSGI
jgi:hypothetical protein